MATLSKTATAYGEMKAGVPETLTVTGEYDGRQFTTTIKVREIVERTVEEAAWLKGGCATGYFLNITTKLDE